MIDHPAFPVEAWTVTETAFSPEVLAQSETIFTVANGYLGLRGNFEEPEPVYQPGTYLNGFYETRPIPFDQEPPSARVPMSETMLNVTDGKVIALTVDGHPLDIRTGTLVSHRRVLDMAGAILHRDVVWATPDGATVRLHTRRLVSLHDPHLAALCYRVEALDAPVDISVVSSLIANESTQVREDDPREAAPLYGQVLLPQQLHAEGGRLVSAYTARRSRLTLVTAAEHHVQSPTPAQLQPYEQPGEIGVRLGVRLQPGEAVVVTKLLAYDWSAHRSVAQLLASAADTLDRAAGAGFEQLADEQRRAASSFWRRTDVVVDGDPAVQQGLRFGLFQLLQAACHAGTRGIAAKGLTGQGYDGHRFWDSEIFLTPILAYTTPAWARDLLGFRTRTLRAARRRAAELDLHGALFPWRTISGADVASYFPEGTAAYHLAADIAHAVTTYTAATDDDDYRAGPGAELLVETARLWMSLGHLDPDRGGAFCIDEVTGPDEYSALVDNNLYTNLMAADNLSRAAATVTALAVGRPDAHGALVAATGLRPEEPAAWQRAAKAVYVPYDPDLDVHGQDDAFLHHAPFDLAAVPPDHYPLLLHYHPLFLYGRQVVKQADVILALRLLGDRFSIEEKRRDFAYYEPITVHDSSLSAASHAVVAAEIGDEAAAVRYLRAAALIDLENRAHNVRDGVHLAGVASAWIAVVEGLAGFRHDDRGIAFAPRLPAGWSRVAFGLTFAGRRLQVEVTPAGTTYRLARGGPLTFRHHQQVVTLHAADRSCQLGPEPASTPAAATATAPAPVPGRS